MAIRVGCGSWADPEYVGVLYPKGLPASERLRIYAQWFERIELNSTYYATPPLATVAGWVKQTPPDFLFDIKLHRAFSGNPRSASEGGQLKKLFNGIQPLIDAKKLGAFLLTLAPSFGPERHRLDELNALAEEIKPYPLAVELRHRDWVEGAELAATLDYFRRRKLAWVALDLPQLKASALVPPIDEVTNPSLAYMRLHGRNPDYVKAKTAAGRHEYDYSVAELGEIIGRIQTLAMRATDVHVSVNNHAKNFAPKAAIALRDLLGQPVLSEPPTTGDEDGQI